VDVYFVGLSNATVSINFWLSYNCSCEIRYVAYSQDSKIKNYVLLMRLLNDFALLAYNAFLTLLVSWQDMLAG